MKTLKRLEVLEIEYAKTYSDGGQDLVVFTLEHTDVDLPETNYSILEVRQQFFERSQDLAIVSTQVPN
jgi:hypothetical protein